MSEKRLGAIPDVPTFSELGYKIDYSIFFVALSLLKASTHV